VKWHPRPASTALWDTSWRNQTGSYCNIRVGVHRENWRIKPLKELMSPTNRGSVAPCVPRPLVHVASFYSKILRRPAMRHFPQLLRQALDLPYPVQEHFDYAIGTSSGEKPLQTLALGYWLLTGGIITIGLFAKY